jgi:hypothetical protein
MAIPNGIVINYDTGKYDFRAWACQMLNFDRLEKLHEQAELNMRTNAPDQINAYRALLIQGFDRFKPVYVHFIQSVIAPIYNGINSYQVPPSFRFHFSRNGNRAFRRDNDHDVKLHLNVWIPFTRVWGSNSIWIESKERNGDFSPAELEYGQALIFDGLNLRHGTFLNETSSSHISMEFRFSPRRFQVEKDRSCLSCFPTRTDQFDHM